jgi:hypothetical protein
MQFPWVAGMHASVNGAGRFVFNTERRLVLLTGRKARTLRELLEHLRDVSGSSVFYHTHHQFLSQHFEKPAFHNDFAKWASQALLEERLAEELTAIDLLAFTSIRQLREAIIATVEDYLSRPGSQTRESRAEDDFHFCESQSFIMPTGIVANDAREFFTKIAGISNVSLFFHFFEARLRLERTTNDFSMWLRALGEERLATELERLDQYTMTLDELRDAIVRIGEAK